MALVTKWHARRGEGVSSQISIAVGTGTKVYRYQAVTGGALRRLRWPTPNLLCQRPGTINAATPSAFSPTVISGFMSRKGSLA